MIIKNFRFNIISLPKLACKIDQILLQDAMYLIKQCFLLKYHVQALIIKPFSSFTIEGSSCLESSWSLISGFFTK